MRLRNIGMTRLGFGTFALIFTLLTASSAKAACGYAPLGKAIPRLPMLGQAEADWRGHEASIVGLWQTIYTTSGGAIFNETLKQWHSDGNEFESAFLPPAAGNVCIGVWKEIGYHEVKLHHLGWLYDGTGKTAANGSFVLDEVDTVAEGGKTYTGAFTFTPYTMEGAKGIPVTGKITAKRVTVD